MERNEAPADPLEAARRVVADMPAEVAEAAREVQREYVRSMGDAAAADAIRAAYAAYAADEEKSELREKLDELGAEQGFIEFDYVARDGRRRAAALCVRAVDPAHRRPAGPMGDAPWAFHAAAAALQAELPEGAWPAAQHQFGRALVAALQRGREALARLGLRDGEFAGDRASDTLVLRVGGRVAEASRLGLFLAMSDHAQAA